MSVFALPLIAMAASAAALFLGFMALRSAVAGFVLYYLACCLVLPAADFLALRKISPRRIPGLLGLRRPTRADLAAGFAAGAAMAAPMLVVLALFKGAVFGDGRVHSVLISWGASDRNMATIYIVMLAFNGAVEELFWRGYLHERLKALPNRFLALGLPTFFFGAQHVFVVSSLVANRAVVGLFLVGILGAGAIWSYMRERIGSVIPCVVSHMIVTAGYMGALFFLAP